MELRYQNFYNETIDRYHRSETPRFSCCETIYAGLFDPLEVIPSKINNIIYKNIDKI